MHFLTPFKEKNTILKHSSSIKEDTNYSKYEASKFPIGKSDNNEFLDLKARVLIKVLNSTRAVCDEKIKENFDIVWYAMNRCRLPNHDASRRIECSPEYGRRIEELRSLDCDFHHGFNSGILATGKFTIKVK